MLHSVELCSGMPCHAMLCCAMLCYAMLCYAMLCYAVPCYALLCHATLPHDMLCYAVAMLWLLCCAMQIYAMLRYATLCCGHAVLAVCTKRKVVLSAGMSDVASEEEVRNLRVEALRCMTRSILRGTIVNVMPGRKLVMSERPPEDLSINPSQQQLGADHLAVLRDNMGQVVEVVTFSPHVLLVLFAVLPAVGAKAGRAVLLAEAHVPWSGYLCALGGGELC